MSGQSWSSGNQQNFQNTVPNILSFVAPTFFFIKFKIQISPSYHSKRSLKCLVVAKNPSFKFSKYLNPGFIDLIFVFSQ